MSACAHKRSISQIVCAVLLVLLFCFGALPAIQASAVSASPLRVEFFEGDGLSAGTPFTPELADLQNFYVEGGTVYISSAHIDGTNGLAPANGDPSLNQRANELAASLTQEFPLNAVLIDFDGALEDANIGISLTGKDLLAYGANDGMTYTPDFLFYVSENVVRLKQLFVHIDKDTQSPEKLSLYYLSTTEETEDVTEPAEVDPVVEETSVDDPVVEETSVDDPIDGTVAEPTEATEITESTETVPTETEATEPVTEETETQGVAEEPVEGVTETEKTVAEESEALAEETEATIKQETVEEVDPEDELITVILKTPEALALERVKNELNTLVKSNATNNTEVADEVVSNDAIANEPVMETTETLPTEVAEERDTVVLLADLPADPSDPEASSLAPSEADPVVEEAVAEEPDVEATETTTLPVDPAMEKTTEETELPVQLQAPTEAPITKLDQRFNVLNESTATLENYLPGLPDKNAFAARMQQRRVEELVTELKGQAATNEHREILQRAENILAQSKLKLEIKSTVVLIGATGESLLLSIVAGGGLLVLGGSLIIIRRRQRYE